MSRTKKSRAPRKTVAAQYAIMTESYAYTFWATLKNISKTGALFSIYGDLMHGESIYACPITDPEIKTLPSPQAIKDHPNHLKGKIVRKEGLYQYGIQFEMLATISDETTEFGTFSSNVEGKDGYYVKMTLEGCPTLEDFIRFDAMVRAQSRMAVCLVLDFSKVTQWHQTSSAILGKTLKAQTKEGRYFFIVNASTLGAGFLKRLPLPSGKNIHYSKDSTSAIEWIINHTPSIMVIEDDELTQHHISKYLQYWNFRVVCVSSAEEGLQKAALQPPSLYLIDIHLPGMDGIQAVGSIRQSIHSHQTPIIMLTVDSTRETVSRTLKNNIQGYIRKPFNPEKLLKSVVDNICSYPRSLNV